MKIFSGLLFFTFFFTCITFSFSQEWKKNIPSDATFNDIKKAFYDFHAGEPSIPLTPELQKFRNEEFRQFKRWENFMKFRSKGSGKINPGILLEELEKFKARKKNLLQNTPLSGWSPLGPFEIPGMGGGMGRLNTMEFHPSDPNIFWVGAACGGLWKTTDGGNSWSTTTDFLPAIGISDIAINPQDPNIMYVATGDGFGYESGGDFWGGTYTAGIMKSVDGGNTWISSGLTFNQYQGRIIQKLVISSADPQILLAASRDGMWRTSDGGMNWTKVSTVHFYDIEYNIADNNIVYASSGSHFYRSNNGGQTWSIISAGLCSTGRQSIAVTPANPNVIYSMCESGKLFRSTDAGLSFDSCTTPPVYFYGYYDNVIAVSPTDENLVFVGGLELGKSTDGGQTWATVDNWWGWPNSDYCHADKHDIAFPPNNGNDVFICNDGGLFKSPDGGNTYINLSSGISISQFYRIGGSALDESILFCGQQDNGVVKKNSGAWDMVVFADGMECAVDYSNPENVLVATQNGQLNLSNDGGNNFSDVTPIQDVGAWITPFVFHPTDPSIVFAGYDELYQSYDGGWSWNPIGNPTGNTPMDVLAVAPSNPDIIYAGTINDLYRSENGGMSWVPASSSLPLYSNALSYVAISNSDPLKLWATLSGYADGQKVYFSSDGGNTWVNYSGSLPNVPANCVVYQDNSADLVYIGNDFGVFYRDSTMADWEPFDGNLPRVIVNELEIQYSTGKIRAATYGRGLWEANLATFDPNSDYAESGDDFSLNVYPNPSSGKFNVLIRTKDSYPAEISVFNMQGLAVKQKTMVMSKNKIFQVDFSDLPPGMYFLRVSENSRAVYKKLVLEK